jgi:DNA (cytosine-5)-methyltransferase 1
MRADLRLCGCQFGLWRLKRERWFETSWRQSWSKPQCNHPERSITIIGHSGHSPSRSTERNGFVPTLGDWQRAMGIDWMPQRDMSQAIPPAYSEYIGRLWLEQNASPVPTAT